MEKKFKLITLNLLLVLILVFVFNLNDAYAHKINGKEHEPITCKLPEDRNLIEKAWCKEQRRMHRLCKLDEWCTLIRLEKLEKENEENVEKLKGVGDCGDLPFNHKASKKTKIYIKASKDSRVVGEVKKGQKLLFYAVSTKNKNFSRVKIRKDNICAEGYIESKFLVKKDAEDTVVKVGPKLIEINEPKWAKEGKLILVDAEGTVSISGAIQEGKIDQIIINEEEEIINGDNTFTYLLFVPNSGAEVRIVGNKNGKKVKELIFTIKVGN